MGLKHSGNSIRSIYVINFANMEIISAEGCFFVIPTLSVSEILSFANWKCNKNTNGTELFRNHQSWTWSSSCFSLKRRCVSLAESRPLRIVDVILKWDKAHFYIIP